MTDSNVNIVNATIITIGDELLIGQVIDTNSAFLAQELNKIGIAVIKRLAVGDDFNSIWQALDDAQKNSKVVIITGGLGPTADDITKPLLCQYFGGEMQMSATNPGVMAGMMPNMIPQPVYRQNSYPATYYAPIPMNQGIMQPQPYYAPYPQEMMGGAMQSPYPGQSQMIPTNMVNSNGQPIYQVIYTTAATSPPLGQFNSPY